MNEGQKMASVLATSPDPEVMPKAKRRIFSASYKKILAEADDAAGTGSIGELLRREGIYSSTLTRWRREHDAAIETAFSQKRGPEPKHNPLTAENEKLRRQNQRLQEDRRIQREGSAVARSRRASTLYFLAATKCGDRAGLHRPESQWPRCASRFGRVAGRGSLCTSDNLAGGLYCLKRE